MQNKYYTVFIRCKNAPEWDEDLLIETTDEQRFENAIKRAKSKDLEITRIYQPQTELGEIDFIKTLSFNQE